MMERVLKWARTWFALCWASTPTELSCNVLKRSDCRCVEPSPGNYSNPPPNSQGYFISLRALNAGLWMQRKIQSSAKVLFHMTSHDHSLPFPEDGPWITGVRLWLYRTMLPHLRSDVPQWRRLHNGSLSGANVSLISLQKLLILTVNICFCALFFFS